MRADCRTDPCSTCSRMPYLNSFPDIQPTNSCRTKERLVTGENNHIHIHLLDIYRDLSSRLRSINGKAYSILPAVFPYLFYGLNGPDHVGGMVDNDKFCIFFEFFWKLIRINKSLLIKRDIIDFNPVIFIQVIKRP